MDINILVINAGSSSLKYQLINMKNEKLLAKGVCERIGTGGATKHETHDGKKFEQESPIKDHMEAFSIVAKLLVDKEYGVLNSLTDIAAVGHRIVQGAEIFKNSAIVDEDVLKKIDGLSVLAPLHNHS